MGLDACGVGVTILLAFSIAAGMQWWAAILFFIGYLSVSVTVSRVRGEFGSPVHDLHFANPGSVMVQLVGTQPFTPRTLTVFTLYYWFNRAHRSHPMPTAMEGLVIGEQLGHGKEMWRGLWLAVLIGMPAACYMLLDPYYRLGADTAQVGGAQRWFGWEAYNRYLLPWLTAGQKLNWGRNRLHCRRLPLRLVALSVAFLLDWLALPSCRLRNLRHMVNGNGLVSAVSGLVGEGFGFALRDFPRLLQHQRVLHRLGHWRFRQRRSVECLRDNRRAGSLQVQRVKRVL
jgi:hypothetical protein